MSKRAKGALAMVLAGAVTFSVTNALLFDPSPKLFTKENASTISGDPKKGDLISDAEKTVKDQTPTTNVKENQSKLSHDISAMKVVQKNSPKTDMAIKAVEQNTKNGTTTISASTNETTTTKRVTSVKAPTSKPTGTNTTSSNTKTVATTIRATSTKVPTNTTAPKPSETSTSNAPTATTNRGQEVSQTAKEKAASHREQKENNGKKL